MKTRIFVLMVLTYFFSSVSQADTTGSFSGISCEQDRENRSANLQLIGEESSSAGSCDILNSDSCNQSEDYGKAHKFSIHSRSSRTAQRLCDGLRDQFSYDRRLNVCVCQKENSFWGSDKLKVSCLSLTDNQSFQIYEPSNNVHFAENANGRRACIEAAKQETQRINPSQSYVLDAY